MSQGMRLIVVFLVLGGMLSGQMTSTAHTHAAHEHSDAQLPHRHSHSHHGGESHGHHHSHRSDHLQVENATFADEGHYCPRCESCEDDLSIVFLPNLTRDRSNRTASCLQTLELVATLDSWFRNAPRLGMRVSYSVANAHRTSSTPLYLRLLSIRC
jgi:hypothetical protein